MTVDSLAPARARAAHRRLEQYVIDCPTCRKPGAAHVDARDQPSGGRAALVRFVCPDGCAVAEQVVLGLLPTGQRTLGESLSA